MEHLRKLEDLHHIVLGHLSDDCNDPDLVRRRISTVLHDAGARDAHVHCAARHEPLPWLEVARRTPAPCAVAEAAVEYVAPPQQADLWSDSIAAA
jgi:hypothetical protein